MPIVSWIDYPHQFYNSNDPASIKTSQMQDQRYIFQSKGMDHRQSFGSAINGTWNMLYSKRKSGCDMLKEDSQTNFLMEIISRKILWTCAWISVCISVWSFGYKKPSIIPHAIGRNLWGKAPQIFPQHDMWTIFGPRYLAFLNKIPR